MRTIVVDVESYYDKEYSLRKMTPVQYILDQRWETIGWAVKDGDAETVWMTDQEFRIFLAGLPPQVAMVSHNALFDMCVLAWRYSYTPTLMIDTLGMARAWMGHKMRSLALASLAVYMKLGQKGTTVHKVQGMSLAAIKAAGFYDEYAEYSKGDADLCWGIYRALINEGFPVSEIAVMDSVLRCAVQPAFVLDQNLLAEHLAAVQADKESLMARVGVVDHDTMPAGASVRDVLMSNEMFASALRLLGVDPPTKISMTTGKETYAFAKTDAAFIELEDHENPDVQALVSARLGVKSTIEETRTQRLLEIAQLTWPGNQQSLMPMPLRYSGAHTHRLAGAWSLNVQNLPSRGNNKIRSAFKAPDGKKVVAVDASQIEARVASWLCGCTTLVSAFANKEDVYSTFASRAFGYEVSKKTHPVERFIGKTCLAAGTLVLTDRGPVAIESVSLSDRLWDGEEWVCHRGVVSNGLKKTLQLSGIWLTPDHDVLCGTQWRPAELVQVDADTHSLALATGAENLPLRVTSNPPMTASKPSSPNVTAAAESLPSTGVTSEISRAHAVLRAGIKQAGQNVTGITRPFFRTIRTAPGYSTASPPPFPGATTRITGSMLLTAGGGYSCTNSGETTGPSFFGMPRHFPAGITRILKWTGLITTGATCRVTSGSAPEARTWTTGEKSTSCPRGSLNLRRSLPVYDLADAGPRHRFTVLTADGPLIVHNCILGLQYGLGWPKFQATVKMQSKAQVGTEVIMDDTDAARVVQTYRREYKEIPQFWRKLDWLIQQMTQRDCYIEVGPLVFMHEKIRLPSGLYLHYHDLQNRDGQWWFTHGGKPKYLYGGKLLENITQALARICVMDAAVRVRRRIMREGHNHIWLNLQVHDELVYICPDEHVDWLTNAVVEEMKVSPAWGLDIPLDAEAGVGQNYGDAK